MTDNDAPYEVEVTEAPAWSKRKITCTALAEWIFEQATENKSGFIQRVAEALASDRRGAGERAVRNYIEQQKIKENKT